MNPYTSINEETFVTSQGVSYQVITQKNDQGLILKEFVSQNTVFAQVWVGPTLPNLSTLLGNEYFSRYQNALKNLNARNHRYLQIQDSELFVANSGRMGSFSGISYLSNRLPVGLSVNEIH